MLVFVRGESAGSRFGRDTRARAVLKVDVVDEARGVASALGRTDFTFVARTPSETHYEAVLAALVDTLRTAPDTMIVWSGRAKSIQHLRRMLAARDVRAKKHLVKAYWAEGRVGLD